jgi:hypothetical protein
MIFSVLFALSCAVTPTWQSPVRDSKNKQSKVAAHPADTFKPVLVAQASPASSAVQGSIRVHNKRPRKSPLPRFEDVETIPLAQLVEMRPVEALVNERQHFNTLFANHPEFKKLDSLLQDPKKVDLGAMAQSLIEMRAKARDDNDQGFTRKLNSEVERYLKYRGVPFEHVKSIKALVVSLTRKLRVTRYHKGLDEERMSQVRARLAIATKKWKAKKIGGSKSAISLVDLMGNVDPNNRPSALQMEDMTSKYLSYYPSRYYLNAAVRSYMADQGYTPQEVKIATGLSALQVHNMKSSAYMAAHRHRKKEGKRQDQAGTSNSGIVPQEEAGVPRQDLSRERRPDEALNSAYKRTRIDSLDKIDWWNPKHL